MVCTIIVVQTLPRRWVYLKMGWPDAYEGRATLAARWKCVQLFTYQVPKHLIITFDQCLRGTKLCIECNAPYRT